MVIDGYGHKVELGDDVVVRCRVVSMRAGDDPQLRLMVYGTYCRKEINHRRDSTGSQHVSVQASACVVQEPEVQAVRKVLKCKVKS